MSSPTKQVSARRLPPLPNQGGLKQSANRDNNCCVDDENCEQRHGTVQGENCALTDDLSKAGILLFEVEMAWN